MPGRVIVRVFPDEHGLGEQTFSPDKPLNAEKLVCHLERQHGPGTLRNAKGERVFANPKHQLEAGKYTFTLGKRHSSLITV